MMLRTRAFSDLARRTGRSPAGQAELEMLGFLELFHPELTADQKRELGRDARDQEKRR